MINIISIKSKIKQIYNTKGKILIVGLGISGKSSALLFAKAGFKVVAVDQSKELKLDELKNNNIEVALGIVGENLLPHLEGVKLAILSPGVGLETPIVNVLKREKIEYIGELEFGTEILSQTGIFVTGSNGKTTTVSIIDEMLRQANLPACLCGNVGTAVTSVIHPQDLVSDNDQTEKILVVECSSYQLETCTKLKPKIAVCLNLSDNHLERHGSLDRYLDAKAKIFQNQNASDFAILNIDDPSFLKFKAKSKAQVVEFGKKLSTAAIHAQIIDQRPEKDLIRIRLGNSQEETYDISKSKLLGLHNRYNLAAAILAARLSSVDAQTIQQVIQDFKPLEHRIEYFADFKQISFINDSKSTTVASSLAAFEAISESFVGRRIVLLLGGIAKIGSWQPLMDRLKVGVGPIICFGEDARVLYDQCQQNNLQALIAANLKAALDTCLQIAKAGDVVLFSPGCLSFDEFSNFEHRGRVFKELVGGLA